MTIRYAVSFFTIFMKISILSYFLLSGLSACNNSVEEKQTKIEFIRPNILSTNPEEYLPGQWAICSEGGEQGIIQYNICSEIVFGDNGRGSLFKGGVIAESINWSINKDSLFLSHVAFYNHDTVQMFPDVNYTIKRSEDSSFVYLTIMQPTKKYFLNLSKTKKVTITGGLFD